MRHWTELEGDIDAGKLYAGEAAGALHDVIERTNQPADSTGRAR